MPAVLDHEPGTDLARLAASYAFDLSRDHPFRDGSKRPAFLAAVIFLGLNGLDLRASEQEVVDNMVSLAAGDLDEEGLAGWIRPRIRARQD